MISFRPRSLTRLALVGFVLVVLPLVATLGAANVYQNRLYQQSEQLVARGIRLARLGKELEEKILAMERNARQYQILEDTSLVELTRERQAELAEIVAELDQSRAEAFKEWHLDQISEDSLAIANSLAKDPPQSLALALELNRFDRLRKLTAVIRTQTDQYIREGIETLQTTARDARHILLLAIVIVVPAVMLLAIYFTILITRPVRQIEDAIQNMGGGSLGGPVKVDGPHELQVLGERLDWLRARLEELEQEKNLFLRRMSHELKTPLASLREGAELLMDGTAGRLTDMQLEIADILRNNSLELQFLIENLLDYERWREKSGGIEISRFAFRPLVDAIIQRHRLIIGNKNLNLDLKVDQCELEADHERIRIMVDNLVSNAIKFTPTGGTIHIRARMQRDSGSARFLALEVADTGPGIPADERSRIFDAFYQGRQPQDGFLSGTGIGLSVVRDCINAHGGTIELVEGEFSGAHFRIHVPSPPHAATA